MEWFKTRELAFEFSFENFVITILDLLKYQPYSTPLFYYYGNKLACPLLSGVIIVLILLEIQITFGIIGRIII